GFELGNEIGSIIRCEEVDIRGDLFGRKRIQELLSHDGIELEENNACRFHIEEVEDVEPVFLFKPVDNLADVRFMQVGKDVFQDRRSPIANEFLDIFQQCVVDLDRLHAAPAWNDHCIFRVNDMLKISCGVGHGRWCPTSCVSFRKSSMESSSGLFSMGKSLDA